MHCDKSAREIEQELQAISDKEKELRQSTRHIDEEIWKLTQRKRSLQDRLHRLREKQHKNDKLDEMEKELQTLRSENRRLVESLERQRADRDDELERLKSEIVELRQQSASAQNVLRREDAMRQERQENARKIDCMSAELESLRRVGYHLRNQLAAAEAMANETRLRQLNQLKTKSAEIEQLTLKLNRKHQQRQRLQYRQLREANLQHLGNDSVTVIKRLSFLLAL